MLSLTWRLSRLLKFEGSWGGLIRWGRQSTDHCSNVFEHCIDLTVQQNGEGQVVWADPPSETQHVSCQPCDDSARKWGQARPMGAQACSTLRSHWSRAVCHQRWSVWESFSRDTGGEAGIRLAGVVTNYFNCFTTAHNCSKLIHKCKEQLLRNCAQSHTYFHNCSKLTVAKNNSFATAHNCTEIFTSAENCLTIARCRDSSAHTAWTSAFNGSV